MTIKRAAPAHHRIRPIRDHVYTFPVVREILPQSPDAVGAQSLW